MKILKTTHLDVLKSDLHQVYTLYKFFKEFHKEQTGYRKVYRTEMKKVISKIRLYLQENK